jgi:hypothetical protein
VGKRQIRGAFLVILKIPSPSSNTASKSPKRLAADYGLLFPKRRSSSFMLNSVSVGRPSAAQ